MLVLSACGGALSYDLRGSDVSPGADAKLTAEVDVQRNLTAIDLKVAHLTPAERVLEGGTAYVVWARRDSTVQWMRLGALQLSDEGRVGVAQLTVSEVAFDLEVSAELNAAAVTPSGKTVFAQRVEGS
ncbi:MAG: hypothetical protein RL701_2644 [Pseudomonadota bacterium]|jgi:hypothetical protein